MPPCHNLPYLYHTRHGHVLHCGCCNRFELRFRTTLVRLDGDFFPKLVSEVNALPVDHWEPESYGVLRLTPPPSPVDINLLLFRHDILELQDLLSGAAAMAELDTMLDETLSPKKRLPPSDIH